MPEVIINGPEGRIETRYHHAEDEKAPLALVLHPHPLYGGTMNNKIVYNLFQLYARNGFSVMRFNFRGVGRSQGSYDEGLGELSDAATALDWMQQQNPNAATCWVGGFSFGAWIAMQLLMRRPELEGFLAISPPANLYDFSFLAPCPSSGLVIQGNRDDVVQEDQVAKLVNKTVTQKGRVIDYSVIDGADHYYRNHMEPMIERSEEYLVKRMEQFWEDRLNQPPPKRRPSPRV